jgi:nitric oxide reductase large subunit
MFIAMVIFMPQGLLGFAGAGSTADGGAIGKAQLAPYNSRQIHLQSAGATMADGTTKIAPETPPRR